MCVKTKIRLLFVSFLDTDYTENMDFTKKRIKKICEIHFFRVIRA